MEIKLDGHFTYKRLIKNAIFPIIMMVVNSIYIIVDGVFISNFVGEAEFAGVNLIFPAIMILASIGFMFGTGSCALVSKKLGEGKNNEANEIFTFIVIFLVIVGIILSTIFFIFMEDIALLFGSTKEMLPTCVLYGRMLSASLVFFMLQNLFQNFFSVAERPTICLIITIVAGITNMTLDAVFVAWLKMGVFGAALATIIAQMVAAIIPILFFLDPKFKSRIHFVKPKANFKAVGQSAYNGLSEFIGNISVNIVCIIFNYQLINYIGQDGVSAYGVITYISTIFFMIFFGFNISTAPIIGFNYGANNTDELKNLLKKCFILVGGLSVAICVLSLALSYPLTKFFVGYNEELFKLTLKGYLIYTISYLFVGFNLFGSNFFTALNNGLVSGVFSGLRTLVIQIACVIIFPITLGVDGIWWSVAISEALSILILGIFIMSFKNKYHYL